jgi:hypothetical protein
LGFYSGGWMERVQNCEFSEKERKKKEIKKYCCFYNPLGKKMPKADEES